MPSRTQQFVELLVMDPNHAGPLRHRHTVAATAPEPAICEPECEQGSGSFASHGAPFSQRMIFGFEQADQRMSGQGRLSYDDVNWDDDLEIVYRRLS